MQTTLPVSLIEIALAIALAGLSVAGFWATRKHLARHRPVAAFFAALLVCAVVVVLAGFFGLSSSSGIALVPALAMMSIQRKPVSADAWLRGGAALAVTLTLVSAFTATLMTTIVATATAGALCWLCAERDERLAVADG